MPDSKLLELAVQSFTANQLAIVVKNSSGAALDKPLTIQLSMPKYLLDQRIRKAADDGPGSPGGVTTLDAIMTGAEANFSVWAKPETSGNFVDLLLFNDLDKTGDKIPAIVLPAGAALTLLIPLDPQAAHATVNVPYYYEYDDGDNVPGELTLKGPDPSDWTPEVTFSTNQKTPSMIEPGTDVIISWKIKDGVSATLRGPLPGGKTERELDPKEFEGSFQILAVGPVTYMLQAEVKRPNDKPNVQVVKLLSLDVYTKNKYGHVEARPPRVLPLGLVEIDWAAWGVNFVMIEAEGGSRRIPLTDVTLSGFRQGRGVMRFNAGKATALRESKVKLNIEINKKPHTEAWTAFDVVPWEQVNSTFTGQPVGCAVVAPKMALLTTDGLWIAEVGLVDLTDDTVDKSLKFSRVVATDSPKSYAIAALGNRFLVLKQTKDNDLQVAFHQSDGKADEVVPIDLPAALRPLMTSGPTVDLAVYRNRAYVVVESQLQNIAVRLAFSVGVDDKKKAEYRPEPLLETIRGYRLLAFDDVLYALNRTSGQMLRLFLKNGKLEPYKAAAAVDQNGTSMVKQGVLVPAGRVMAVLSPNAVPSLASVSSVGLRNTLSYQQETPPKSAGSIVQDVVYSPQTDTWVRCGHGLDVTTGFAGYRDGDSPRLWLIEPNATTHTLTVGSEHLFVYNFVDDEASKPLHPYFNKDRRLAIINNTGLELLLPNETCIRAGLPGISSSNPVEMVPPLTDLKAGVTTFDLRFNDADEGPVVLRFMVKKQAGVKHDYVLELTLSGPSFSSATTVFKRIAGGAVAEIPDTREYFGSTLAPIEFSPKPLINGIKLNIRNATPYRLWQRSPGAADPEKEYAGEEIKIKYNTPPFSIYAHGAGELFFDIDFALPHGLEVTSGTTSQKNRIRINKEHSLGLIVESKSVEESREDAVYKCTLRYNYDRPLSGIFIGDGVPTGDGASIYIPLAHTAWADQSQIIKYRANDLLIEASTILDGGAIFSAPNSIAVLSDRVLAAVRSHNWIGELSHELKYQGGFPTSWHDVITNLKGSPDQKRFYTLGMKEQSSGAIKHSYSYAARTFPEQFDTDLVLDSQKGFRPPPPVDGAPAWVSPNNIAPMDVWSNLLVAVCVQGGLFQIVVNGKEVTEVKIDDAGREEAVFIDADGGAFFCAHQPMDKRGLMVSRVNIGEPSKKKTVTLPGSVTGMVTNPKPPTTDNLSYNCPRAVSLIATPDALYVSHARIIYVLDKTTLEVRQTVPVNLPCRLVQVRRGKLSSETDPKYGTPRDCDIVWAIGSMYIGDGTNRQNYQTSLYKIGIV